MDSAPSACPPCRYGNFTTLAQLGRGAMGEVFLAVEDLTGRKVALKVMRAGLGGDGAFLRRFEREALLLAALQHPAIPHYAGSGVDGGRPWLAIEYVEGPPLRRWLADGARVPERVALALTLQAAEALAFAHQRHGVVHRDVKPDNLLVLTGPDGLLSERCRIKVIDFGIAHATVSRDYVEFGQAEDEARLTVAGNAIGTPWYMAPEQVRGDQEITFAADLYALGATLFHLLTGRPPFVARSPAEVLVAHLKAPVPDPASLDGGLRPATCGLVMRALAKEPGQRHRSWDQFIAASKGALAICERLTTAAWRRPPVVQPAPAPPPAATRTGSDSARLAVNNALAGLPAPPRYALPPPPAEEHLPTPAPPAQTSVADWISSRFLRKNRKP